MKTTLDWILDCVSPKNSKWTMEKLFSVQQVPVLTNMGINLSEIVHHILDVMEDLNQVDLCIIANLKSHIDEQDEVEQLGPIIAHIHNNLTYVHHIKVRIFLRKMKKFHLFYGVYLSLMTQLERDYKMLNIWDDFLRIEIQSAKLRQYYFLTMIRFNKTNLGVIRAFGSCLIANENNLILVFKL